MYYTDTLLRRTLCQADVIQRRIVSAADISKTHVHVILAVT